MACMLTVTEQDTNVSWKCDLKLQRTSFEVVVLCYCGETGTDAKDIKVVIKLYNTGDEELHVLYYCFQNY